MSKLDPIIDNIKDIYVHLISNYNPNENNRILLEQIWVLKKIVIDTEIDTEFKNEIGKFYISLQNEVFN